MEEVSTNLDEILSSFEQIINGASEDGINILASILAMSDESFEAVKPILLDNFEKTLNDPIARIALSSMINEKNIDFNKLMLESDDISKLFDNISEKDLSTSKKDFIKEFIYIFVNAFQDSIGISKRIIQIPIELCRENAKLPTYATDGSAAMDVYSPEEYTIDPGKTVLIPLGFKVDIPRGYALLLQPRSGMSLKTKVRICNTPGLIDSDYHEEIGLLVENIEAPIQDSADGLLHGRNFTIGKGERCAQMRLVEVPMVNWLEVESIGKFENDHGTGFGGTGKD